ncbi:hypothetical protein DPMN_133354 [Dreissena polymorpha]|uniref:Uncharacterized protein n=1 Tax=Dreissena polymorpha TaxID=45954 RepID=A0A9D4JEQ4_DREPO|nr:hypothetical protein DPMN_133354 [Dreissena polymorpha]
MKFKPIKSSSLFLKKGKGTGPILLQNKWRTHADSDSAISKDPWKVVQKLSQRKVKCYRDAAAVRRLDASNGQERSTWEGQGLI